MIPLFYVSLHAEMKRFALIGRRLGHSYSQQWFEGLFSQLGLHDHTYALHEMPSLAGLRQWVECNGICGFNVTVPYKQEIIPYLDALDATAMAIGAVNCVTVEGNRLFGHNTDAGAFKQSLEHTGWDIHRAFVLGTGGAARAVAYALRQMGIPCQYVSRTPRGDDQIGYEQLSSCHSPSATLLVNATPVGMYPDIDNSPVADPDFPYVFDLTYNPSPTRLMRDASIHGAQVKDGLEMLHLQAEMSWAFFRQCEV